MTIRSSFRSISPPAYSAITLIISYFSTANVSVRTACRKLKRAFDLSSLNKRVYA